MLQWSFAHDLTIGDLAEIVGGEASCQCKDAGPETVQSAKLGATSDTVTTPYALVYMIASNALIIHWHGYNMLLPFCLSLWNRKI